MHIAETLLFQSDVSQFSLPQLNGSLIVSFQPVPQETLALLPRWHFAHALIQKTAAGGKLGLVAPSEEGVLYSIPCISEPGYRCVVGLEEVGCLPLLQMDPSSSVCY